ncbi:MAG: GNAT family N-acetyltransferase [Armatimonadetes bacterium]|nr:GNAT family N-acetyltransferase [Armatimonadota bacterium]
MGVHWLRAEDLGEWDSFQQNDARGHYCQLSTWLRSFRSFGGVERILAVRNESGELVGGLGVVAWRRAGIELWVAPAGPVVQAGWEDQARVIVEEMREAARSAGAIALLLQPAVGQTGGYREFLLPSGYLPETEPIAAQRRVPGLGIAQMLWVDFSRVDESAHEWESSFLATFSRHTRRNIRSACASSLTSSEAVSEAEIKEVYGLIEENGLVQGYATRTWAEFGPTLVEQVRKSHAILLGVRSDGELVGAHYGVLAGRRYNYVMGGTKRTAGNLKVGHFAHWSAIMKAHELGLLGYDFTSPGTPGVDRFKMGFNPVVIRFVPPQQIVFRRWYYHLWERLLPFAERHKRALASLAGIRDHSHRGVRGRSAVGPPQDIEAETADG